MMRYSSPSLRARLLAGVSVVLIAGPAMLESAAAQESRQPAPAATQNNDDTTLPTVTVTSGRQSGVTDPYQVPGPVSEIGAADIATSGGDVRDALRDVPGTFTRTSIQNPGIAVNLRGMEGAGRVNMMIDGVRQSFRFTGHEAAGFTYVDPNLLAGVGIERGAVATTGGGGLAGSANFRTLGVDDLIKPGKQWGAMGKLGFGSNHMGFSETLAAAARLSPNFAFAAAISRSKPGNYANGDAVRVLGTAQDLISGLVKADITFSESAKLALGAVFYNNEFFANSYYQTLSNNTFTGKFSYKPLDNKLVDFRLNVAYNYLEMKYPLSRNTGSSRGRVIQDGGWGIDASNTSRFSAGPLAVEAKYGAEYFHDDVDVVNSAATPGYGVNPTGQSGSGAVFAQAKFTYGIVDLTPALRYGFYSLGGKGGVVAANPFGMPAGPYTVDRDQGRLSPKITLAVRSTDWFEPYITYGETFRPPTISETLTGGEHPGVGAMTFLPNPFLKPEISRGWEIGVNFRRDNLLMPEDKARLKIDYFRNNVRDYVSTCLYGPGFPYFCNNAGTSLVQGVEVEGEYDAGFAFTKLAYTHTSTNLPSQLNGFGAQSFLPDDVLSWTIGARFLARKVTVGGRLNWVSQSYIGAINVSPGVRPYTPSYETVDLFARYQITPHFELAANVTNLFDRAYTGALTTSAGNTPVLNGRGRTMFLSAKATF